MSDVYDVKNPDRELAISRDTIVSNARKTMCALRRVRVRLRECPWNFDDRVRNIEYVR